MTRRLVLLLAALGLAPVAAAQTGGGYDMSWNSVEPGAAVATGGNYSLVVNGGQADATAGNAGGAYVVDGGLLPGICGGTIETYGTGCPGTGGFTPQFNLRGCPANGYDVVVEISQGLGGQQAFLFLGFGEASLPMGGGCTLNVFPLFPTPIGPVPLSAGGPGGGSISLPFLTPPTLDTSVVTIKLQAFVSDPTAPSGVGFSNSNGVSETFG